MANMDDEQDAQNQDKDQKQIQKTSSQNNRNNNMNINNIGEMINAGIANKDIAETLITNTLLNTMKTGQPLIDSITSLVFISKFKNPVLKNVSIVFVLIMGMVFHRITSNVDILKVLYEKLLACYNSKLFVKILPQRLQKTLTVPKQTGSSMSLLVSNRNSYYQDIRYLYNLITMLHKVVELYPNIDREILKADNAIGWYPDSSQVHDRFLSMHHSNGYFDFERRRNMEHILNQVGITLFSPPKPNVWYKVSDDIYFTWSFIENAVKKDDSENSERSSRSSRNSEEHKYQMMLKSDSKTYKELANFLDESRTALIDRVTAYEKDRDERQQKYNESLPLNLFKGTISELVNETKKTEDGKYETKYKRNAVATFGRQLESVFFREKEQLINILDNFNNKTGIYRRLPHRRKIGIMIHGTPGTGKTSLSVAIATQLRRDIVRVSLKDKTLDDEKLSHILNTYTKGFVIILDELDTHEAFKPRVPDTDSSSTSDSDIRVSHKRPYERHYSGKFPPEYRYADYRGASEYRHDYKGHHDYSDPEFSYASDSDSDDDDTDKNVNKKANDNKKVDDKKKKTEDDDEDNDDLEDLDEEPKKKNVDIAAAIVSSIEKHQKKQQKAHKKQKKHKIKNMYQKLTLGAFLEAMDGVSTTEDRIVIAMTNHPKMLDPAILRPGRFDMMINMDNRDAEDTKSYIKYVFDDYKGLTDEDMSEAAQYVTTHKLSMAILEQACVVKFSSPNKTLSECLKSVHESFEEIKQRE
jgi:SpoVK/Ycf46/Vps4 family AAA+-type ATPase